MTDNASYELVAGLLMMAWLTPLVVRGALIGIIALRLARGGANQETKKKAVFVAQMLLLLSHLLGGIWLYVSLSIPIYIIAPLVGFAILLVPLSTRRIRRKIDKMADLAKQHR